MNDSISPETLCEQCGHARKYHFLNFKGRHNCLFPDLPKDYLCICHNFTVTVSFKNLPGRLTEAEIIERAAKRTLP